MKKNYFLGTLMSLLMLVALPVKAQVSSMVDLYGTYTFTADMTVSEDGKQYESSFGNDCEVKISKDDTGIGWDALISGVAGASAMKMQVNGIDTEEHKFKIQNCFSSSYWGSYIYMSNLDGLNPFLDSNKSILGDMYFTYDPSTKTITIPDFTLVKMVDYEAEKGTILATFKNVKLTLTAGESVEIIDLSGDWHFKAGEGTYDKMPDSELPYEFDMVVTKTSDDNKNYKVAFNYHTFDTVELTATFDGASFTLDLDSTLLDKEKGILIRNYWGGVSSDLSLSLVSENVLSLSDYAAIVAYVPATEEKEAHFQTLQYFIGTAKRAGVETEKYDWAGTFTVKAGQVNDFSGGTVATPAEFKMAIYYSDYSGAYYISDFWGNNINAINYGGIRLDASAENLNEATIKGGGLVGSAGGGLFYTMLNKDGSTNPIAVKVNEDGTIAIDDFFIIKSEYQNYTDFEPIAMYVNVTATKDLVNAIESVQQNTAKANGKTYDLSGRLVKKAAKGIFIVNGKKVIVK